MSDDHTTAETGSAGDTTTDTPTDTPTGGTTTEAAGTDTTTGSAAGTAAATTESSGRKSWRGRSRAEKPEKAEKAPKSEKPARAKQEKEPVAEKKRRGAGVGAGVKQVRSIVGRLIWVVCLVFALALAITALLIALKANADNDAVRFIVSFADRVDLGIFDLTNPIKDFDTDKGPARDVKTALFNYGIGAIVWLLIGRIGDKVVRP